MHVFPRQESFVCSGVGSKLKVCVLGGGLDLSRTMTSKKKRGYSVKVMYNFAYGVVDNNLFGEFVYP